MLLLTFLNKNNNKIYKLFRHGISINFKIQTIRDQASHMLHIHGMSHCTKGKMQTAEYDIAAHMRQGLAQQIMEKLKYRPDQIKKNFPDSTLGLRESSTYERYKIPCTFS